MAVKNLLTLLPRKKRQPHAERQRLKYTKTEILNEIAQNTSLSKKEVSSVLDELSVVIERHIKKRAVGEFRYGLVKIKSVERPARPARKGVQPFQTRRTNGRSPKAGFHASQSPALEKLKEFAL